MANSLLCWPNRAANAVVTGGDWSGNSLQSLVSELHGMAMSNGATLEATQFKVTLNSSYSCRVFALCNHNLGFNAKVRLTAYGASGDVRYTSGWVPVWESVYEVFDLEWEDDNFWMGTISEEDAEASSKNFYLDMGADYFIKSIFVEIWDEVNSDHSARIGHLILAPVWEPVTNIDYGSKLGVEDPSTILTSLDGTEHAQEKKKNRVALISLTFMSEIEGTKKAFNMMMRLGVTGELFFIWDPEDKAQSHERSFRARIRTLSPLDYPQYSLTGTSYELKEIL